MSSCSDMDTKEEWSDEYCEIFNGYLVGGIACWLVHLLDDNGW